MAQSPKLQGELVQKETAVLLGSDKFTPDLTTFTIVATHRALTASSLWTKSNTTSGGDVPT